MKKLLFLLIITFLFSCGKEEIKKEINDDNIIINNDMGSLSSRMILVSSPPDVDFQGRDLTGFNKSFGITLVAQLLPPSLGMETLQASHIRIVGNHAYIAYNTQGPRYLGGVDIVNISNPNVPVLISNATWDGKDISSIDVESQGSGNHNRVWLAGAEENNEDLETPAIVERYELNSSNQFKHVSEPRRYYDLKGYVGTDIKFSDQQGPPTIYATSGTDGGLTILNNGLNLKEPFLNLDNARSVDVNSNYVIAFGGNPGHLYRPNWWYQFIGGATDPEAKSMVRLSGSLAIVALGEEGVKVFDLASGTPFSPASSLPRPEVPEGAINPWEYVSNAVSVSGNTVYIANGAAGLDIATLNGSQLVFQGNIDLGASANFVDAGSGYIFVATGLGGLSILKVTSK